MRKRILSAAVGILFAIFVFTMNITRTPWLLNLIIAIIACISLYEILLATKFVNNPGIVATSFAATAIIQFIPIFPPQYWTRIFVCVSVAYYLALMIVLLASHKSINLERTCVAAFVTELVALPYFSILYIYWQNPYDSGEFRPVGQALVIFCFAIAWATDTFALFTGKLIGKHKLAPEISPNKTIEGAIGGLVFGNLFVYLLAYLLAGPLSLTELEVNWRNLIIISIISSVVSMIGDLSFSIIKRNFDVKDFGNIMPGHGGVLDRFDSVLFVCPVVCVLNMVMPVIIR